MRDGSFGSWTSSDPFSGVDWTVVIGIRFQADGVEYSRARAGVFDARSMFEVLATTSGGVSRPASQRHDTDERVWLESGDVVFTDEDWQGR